MSPVVLEDGAIHHTTRLSLGPAWLTAAIYLNVIGSKLVRGKAVRKEGYKGKVEGSLGISQRLIHSPSWGRGAVLWRGWGVTLSVVLNLLAPSSFSLVTLGVRQGRPQTEHFPGSQVGAGGSSSGETL